MKKSISLLALGAITAFYTVDAQEQNGSVSTDNTDTTYQQQSQNVQDQDKKKIDESELPDQVRQSLKESQYGDMDIVVVYEVDESKNLNETENKSKTMKWNEAQSQTQTSDTTGSTLNNGQEVIKDQEDARNRGSETSDQDESQTRDNPVFQPGETSDTTQSNSDKGVEYDSDSEAGYSTSPGEEQTYPKTEYGTSQTDENKQAAETSAVESSSNENTKEDEQADQLNQGDQQRQNDQLELENDQGNQPQTKSSDSMSESEKMYEVQVEDEDKVMILVFTEEGELRQATEGDTDN